MSWLECPAGPTCHLHCPALFSCKFVLNRTYIYPYSGQRGGIGRLRRLSPGMGGSSALGFAPVTCPGLLGVLALFQPSGSCPFQHDGWQCSGSHFRAPIGEEQPFSSAPFQTCPGRTLPTRPHTPFSCDTRHTLVQSPAQWTASSLGLVSLTCLSQHLAWHRLTSRGAESVTELWLNSWEAEPDPGGGQRRLHQREGWPLPPWRAPACVCQREQRYVFMV